MIKIAGSGPSANSIEHVDVATKKRPVPSDYVFCLFEFHAKRGNDLTPLMIYHKRNGCNCKKCTVCKADKYFVNSRRWDSYYKQFVRSKRPPQRMKPSSGLCAVFAVVERWKPETIGLIGYDRILDGDPFWEHDAEAERQAILSLVNVKDLRNGNTYPVRGI